MTKSYLERQFENYHSITGGVVTPQMFGALADGVHDDTEAIQQAMASDYVYFPQGTYLCSKQMVLHSNQKVLGAGKDLVTVIFTDDGLSTGQTYTRGRVVTGISDYRYSDNTVSNIYLEGITFTSNYLVTSLSAGKTLVYLTNCENVYIKNVGAIIDVVGDFANAFETLANVHNITFEECYFEQTQETTAGCCELRDTRKNTTDKWGSSNIKILNCEFYKRGGNDEVFAIFTESSSVGYSLITDVLVDGCTFTYEKHTLEGGSDPAHQISVCNGDTRNILFSNCTFNSDCTTYMLKSKAHIYNGTYEKSPVIFDNCTINNNGVSNAEQKCVLFTELSSEIGTVMIYRNGKIYHNALCSLMANDCVSVENTLIHITSNGAGTNSGKFKNCTIEIPDGFTFISSASADFDGCKFVNTTDTQVNQQVTVQARSIRNCTFDLTKILQVLAVSSNKEHWYDKNVFNCKVKFEDYNSNGKSIYITNNEFKNNMSVSNPKDTNLQALLVAYNKASGNTTISQSAERMFNSFDAAPSDIDFATELEVV